MKVIIIDGVAGGVIPEESELMVATAPMFQVLFKVDARTQCEAIAISPQ